MQTFLKTYFHFVITGYYCVLMGEEEKKSALNSGCNNKMWIKSRGMNTFCRQKLQIYNILHSNMKCVLHDRCITAFKWITDTRIRNPVFYSFIFLQIEVHKMSESRDLPRKIVGPMRQRFADT